MATAGTDFPPIAVEGLPFLTALDGLLLLFLTLDDLRFLFFLPRLVGILESQCVSVMYMLCYNGWRVNCDRFDAHAIFTIYNTCVSLASRMINKIQFSQGGGRCSAVEPPRGELGVVLAHMGTTITSRKTTQQEEGGGEANNILVIYCM